MSVIAHRGVANTNAPLELELPAHAVPDSLSIVQSITICKRRPSWSPCPGRFASLDWRWAAWARIAAATVVGEESEEVVHDFEVCGVDYESPVMACCNQPSIRKFLQVERERWRGYVQPLADCSRAQTVRAACNKQTVNCEPRFLRECRERLNDVDCFHISNNVKII